MRDVALIQGDGIGPEISEATVRVVEASGAKIRWVDAPMGETVRLASGSALPLPSLATVRKTGAALKAPMVAERASGGVVVVDGNETRRHPSVNSGLRRELSLFVNLRPVRGFPGVSGRHAEMDTVIFREITEDTYAGIERMVGDDRAEATKVITRAATRRIAQYACAWALERGRKTITAVHKANVLHLTDGLFLQETRRVVEGHPGLTFDDRMVDATCYHMIKTPRAFDCLVLPSQYGDILSDVAAGCIGSLGLCPGANIGEGVVVAEAAHGAAPDIAGQGVANPLGLILSAALLLDQIGERAAGDRIRAAVTSLLAEGRVLTPDLGGRASSRELVDQLCGRMTSA